MEHEAMYVYDRCKQEKQFSDIAVLGGPEGICNPFMELECICFDCEEQGDGTNKR